MPVVNSVIPESVIYYEPCNIYASRIGERSSIAAFVEIGGSVVGQNCRIQAFAYLCPGVTIGNNVFIGPHVCFTNDKYPLTSMFDDDFKPIRTFVDDNAAIGAGAIILPGVTIGKFAMVGAGAVVLKDVKPGTTVVGNPARVVS